MASVCAIAMRNAPPTRPNPTETIRVRTRVDFGFDWRNDPGSNRTRSDGEDVAHAHGRAWRRGRGRLRSAWRRNGTDRRAWTCRGCVGVEGRTSRRPGRATSRHAPMRRPHEEVVVVKTSWLWRTSHRRGTRSVHPNAFGRADGAGVVSTLCWGGTTTRWGMWQGGGERCRWTSFRHVDGRTTKRKAAHTTCACW